MTKALALTLAALSLLTFACGGDDDDTREAPPELVAELADVCTETDEVAGDDVIQIASPQPGDLVESPIVIEGVANAFNGTVWIAVVKADGEHLIDYPGRTDDHDAQNTLVPYSVSIPFTVFEETPACLWVFRRNIVEPEDAVRVPLILAPVASPAP